MVSRDGNLVRRKKGVELTRSTITPNLAKYDPLNGDWKDMEICNAL